MAEVGTHATWNFRDVLSKKMDETVEVQEIYCTECDRDYRLAWAKSDDQLYAVCDCDGVQTLTAIDEQFADDRTADETPSRGFQ